MPTIIGVSKPSGMPSLASLANLNNTAPPITGTLIKKLTRAAASRVKPNLRAAVIVMPEREVPGLRAITWARPISIASRAVNELSVRSPAKRSAHNNTSPKTINETAIITGLPSFSVTHCSPIVPAMPAGIADATKSHALRPICLSARFGATTMRIPSRT